MAVARDGSLQLGFGLGKYTNRDVMDGYAGVSRGVEQITVRASRELGDDPSAPSSDRSATRWSSRCGRCASRSSRTTSSRSPSTGCSRRCCRRTSRTAPTTRTGGPARPPTSCATTRSAWLGVGRGRRRAHRDHPRHVGVDPRPLVGRALRRRRPAHRPRAGRRPRGPVVPVRLVPGATSSAPTARRYGLFLT